MKHGKLYTIVILILSACSLILNVLACSSAFCDSYTTTVYAVLSDLWGRIFGILPFPMGEILMYLAVVLVILTILLSLLLIVFHKHASYRRFTMIYLKSMLMLFLSVILIYTLHWVIPYRSSLLGAGRTYQFADDSGTTVLQPSANVLPNITAGSQIPESSQNSKIYTRKELQLLRSYIVENLNECCETVPRDADGHVVYPSTADMEQSVTQAMLGISDEFPRLAGYYPPMKIALCSDVLDWMNIGGYTYPYTMEITYNQYVSDLYYPTLISHEAAHHQGYYQENEANFLSYLGCSRSDDPILRYSAYLYIYDYINDDYGNALIAAGADDSVIKACEREVLDQVWIDAWESYQESVEVYENDSHPLENLSDTASDVAEVGWDAQTEIIQENGYDGVVKLMLIYYDGILY